MLEKWVDAVFRGQLRGVQNRPILRYSELPLSETTLKCIISALRTAFKAFSARITNFIISKLPLKFSGNKADTVISRRISSVYVFKMLILISFE